MTYEIEMIEDLYCVFENNRIIAAFSTKKEAKEAVNTYHKDIQEGKEPTMEKSTNEDTLFLAHHIAKYESGLCNSGTTEKDVLECLLSMPEYVYSNLLENYEYQNHTASYSPEDLRKIIAITAKLPGAVQHSCTVYFTDGDAITCALSDIGVWVNTEHFSHATVQHKGIDKYGEVSDLYDYTITH